MKKIFSTAMLICLAASFLRAQNPTAKITGTITDASGAVVPGASVVVINDATRQKLEGRTNESGIYLISFINPGTYSFSAEAPSFRRYVRQLTLVTGQVLELDLALELGPTTESVTVNAATPLIQSATSSISNLIENAFIRNMPMESSRVGSLVRLLPGVTYVSESTFEDILTFSIAGGPANRASINSTAATSR